MAIDPLTSKYPGLTPYQFASNSPIAHTDVEGLEADGENTNQNVGTAGSSSLQGTGVPESGNFETHYSDGSYTGQKAVFDLAAVTIAAESPAAKVTSSAGTSLQNSAEPAPGSISAAPSSADLFMKDLNARQGFSDKLSFVANSTDTYLKKPPAAFDFVPGLNVAKTFSDYKGGDIGKGGLAIGLLLSAFDLKEFSSGSKLVVETYYTVDISIAGASRSAHRDFANRALVNTLENNPAFAKAFNSELGTIWLLICNQEAG
jgi:hypothetical protein